MTTNPALPLPLPPQQTDAELMGPGAYTQEITAVSVSDGSRWERSVGFGLVSV